MEVKDFAKEDPRANSWYALVGGWEQDCMVRCFFFTFGSCISDYLGTSYNIAEMRALADLDAEKGRQPRPDIVICVVIHPRRR